MRGGGWGWTKERDSEFTKICTYTQTCWGNPFTLLRLLFIDIFNPLGLLFLFVFACRANPPTVSLYVGSGLGAHA